MPQVVKAIAVAFFSLLASAAFAAGDAPIVTRHVISIDGKALAYTAEAGRIAIHDGVGRATGEMFYTAYRKPLASNARPVVFLWNGGPGANSTPLHFEAFGPRRLTGYMLVDNDTTLLTDADLVFVDPIGTGFSRPASEKDAAGFYSTLGDFAAMTQFVRNWLAFHHAQKAPVFLVGESFGVWRAAAVAQELEEQGRPVAGVVLISGGAGVGTGYLPRDLTVALRTPNRAAAALSHGKLAPDLGSDRDTVVSAATTWAKDVYVPALEHVATLDDAERGKIATSLARFTGLKPEQINRATLVMSPRGYLSALLKDEGKTLDTFDMRLTQDPTVNGAAIDGYFHNTLHYKTALAYVGLDDNAASSGDKTAPRPGWINAHWNYDSAPITPDVMAAAQAGEGPPGSLPWALNAIRIDPRLKVLVAAGLYDSLNSCAANDVLQTRFPADAAGNFAMKCYLGGHMMYRDGPARHQLSADIKTLISGAAQH